MGCDIHGYVEVDKRHSNDDDGWWKPAGNLFPFVGRSYDSFGCLFGVRNYAGFDPVAENRGLPANLSREVRTERNSWGEDGHSDTYLTFAEVLEIDWSEQAERHDRRYSILDENKEPTGTKFSLGPASGWTDIVEANQDAIDNGKAIPNEDGGKYIQRRKPTREEAISGSWDWVLNEYMALLADRFDNKSVRLVVWFDN